MNRPMRTAALAALLVPMFGLGVGAASANAAELPRCEAADVEVTMGMTGEGNQASAQLLLTIVGERACTFEGFLTDLRFTGADGKPLTTTPMETQSGPVEKVGGEPGYVAAVDTTWTRGLGQGDVVPAKLTLRLPGAEQLSEVAWSGGAIGNNGAIAHSVVGPAVG
ncbi:DUF4232 domain-containing protein [Allokutzneria oryzae]|uniref:DUF4232 domain-containing protein n=1 Tax=Allokutzneria oryzae TaxID=1378989 RepID=A0ABV5ZUK5_9PSEU